MSRRYIKGGYLWQRWRDIQGYEGCYKVSTLGRIKGLKRSIINIDGARRSYRERILKSSVCNGYLAVGLSKNSILKTSFIHVLTAIAFLNHVPCGHDFVIDHKDGVKTKNYLSNLQVVTQTENITICFKKKRGSALCKYINTEKQEIKY